MRPAPTTSTGSAEAGTGRRWAVALVLAVLAITALYAHWALRVWWWQPDELEYRGHAEWFTDALPQSIWALGDYGRGIQRLVIWELGASLGMLGSPDGFRLARVIQVGAFVSTAFPVWLWARAAGASRPWAGWAAVLAVAVPWAVVGATFLTEPLAYPLATWACFATWRTAVVPSAGRDLVAVAAVGGASLARTGFVQLGVALVAVCLVLELRLGPGTLRVRLRAFARGHVVLVGAFVVGAVVVLTGLDTRFTGVYGERGINPHLRFLGDAITYSTAIAGSGTAFAPLIAAIALAIAQLARPVSREALALGLVVPALFAVLVMSAVLGGREERYVFFIAAVGAVVLARGATLRDAPAWSIAVATVLVAGAVLLRSWHPDLGAIGYIAFPAETFQARVIQQGLYSHLPDVLEHGRRMFAGVIAAFGGAAATVLVCAPSGWWRRAAAVARPLVAAGLVAVGFAQAGYALAKFERAVRGAPIADRAWIDRAADGETVGVWLPPLDPAADMGPIWQEERYFNVDAGPDVAWRTRRWWSFLGEARVAVSIDPRDGRIVPQASGVTIPRLMLVPRLPQPAQLRAAVVARDPRLAVDLVRFTTPRARVAWIVTGAYPDGWIHPGRPARVRAFAPDAATRFGCVRMKLAAPPDEPRLQRASVTTGGTQRRVRVSAGRSWSGTVPVRYRDGHADIAVRVAGGRLFPGGRTVAGRLSVLGTGSCA